MVCFMTIYAQAPSKKAGKKVSAAPKKAQGAGKVAKVRMQCAYLSSRLTVFQADWKEGFKKKQVGVSDMTLLTTISNEAINENLKKRWTNGEIYTYIGAVLISVNPFRGAHPSYGQSSSLTAHIRRSGHLYG